MPNRHKRILSASSIIGTENGMPSLTAMSLRSHVRFSPEILAANDDDIGEDELIDEDEAGDDFDPSGDYFEESIQDSDGEDEMPLPVDPPMQAQEDVQHIQEASSSSRSQNRLKTKDQLFNLKGIDMPSLQAPKADPCIYKFAELQDKSKELPGWKDGHFRWERDAKVPEYMPQFLVYRKHPRMRDPLGVAFVYEGCPELLLYNHRFFKNLTIPLSVKKHELDSLGLLELEPHMYIFYRNVRESRDPKNDLLKMWVTDEEEVTSTCEHQSRDALLYRDKLLGDKETLKGGKKKGTHLEQSGRGHGNGQGDRCLTFMQSIESQRGIGHPPGNMSQAYMKGDETLSDLKEFEKNVFGLATTMLRQYAPEDWIADQVKRFLINNLPAIGVDDNQGFFSQQQVNLAGVEKAESEDGLDKNMGKAGLPHYDPKDCPQGYTCMFATSNFDSLGDQIHPGFFHFLEVGLYVKCTNFRLVYFSGLHFHGGSPPRAEKDFTPPDWCTRFNNILYPNDFLLSGFLAMVLAVAAGLSRIEVLSAIRYDPKGPATIAEGPLNFIRDGDSIMSRDAYIVYVCRQIMILLESMLNQSPHVRLNMDALKTLFIDRETNEVVNVWDNWEYSPDKLASKSEDMAAHSRYMESKKVDVCLSVPTQLRRLYNSNKLRMAKEDGASDRGTLRINQDALLKAKKKQKVRHQAQEDSNAFGHGEELPTLRRSTRKRSNNAAGETSDNDDFAEESLLVVKAPNGLPSMLDKRLKIIEFPPFTFSHLKLLDDQSSLTQPHHLSKNALTAMLTDWSNNDAKDMSGFIQTTSHWTRIEHGSHVGDAMDLGACILRAQRMFGHWIWWCFLRQEVPWRVDVFLQGNGDTSTHWVHRIISYVNSLYDKPKHQQSVMVSFRDVFRGVYMEYHSLFPDANLGQLGIILQEQRNACLVTHTCEVIAQWVMLPHSQRDKSRNTGFGDWDTRGYFVDAILRTGHPGLLLLSELYKVYNFVRLPTLSEQDGYWIEESLMDAFNTDDDEINLRIESLDSIAFHFLPNEMNGLVLPPPVDSVSIIPSAPSMDSISLVPHSPLTLEDIEALTHVSAPTKRAGDAIVTFLCDIERLYGPSWADFVSRIPDGWTYKSVIPNISQSELICHWVAWNRDHYCPFRRNAPSLYTFLWAFGDRSYLTPSAFLSLTVFRGITFYTDYVRDAFIPQSGGPRPQMVLRDLDHWKQLRQEITDYLTGKNWEESKIRKYFCNKRAYGGSPNTQRKVENADLYWNAAIKWGETFGKRAIPIPYEDFKSFWDEQKKKGHLFNLGDLTHMLILADLNHAGVVKAPPEKEFFKLMLKAGAGAADGLRLLDLVDNLEDVNRERRERGEPIMKADDPIRVQATKDLYNYARSSLHRLGKSHLLPDFFSMEHLLCKVKRVITIGPRQYQAFSYFFKNVKASDVD